MPASTSCTSYAGSNDCVRELFRRAARNRGSKSGRGDLRPRIQLLDLPNVASFTACPNPSAKIEGAPILRREWPSWPLPPSATPDSAYLAKTQKRRKCPNLGFGQPRSSRSRSRDGGHFFSRRIDIDASTVGRSTPASFLARSVTVNGTLVKEGFWSMSSQNVCATVPSGSAVHARVSDVRLHPYSIDINGDHQVIGFGNALENSLPSTTMTFLALSFASVPTRIGVNNRQEPTHSRPWERNSLRVPIPGNGSGMSGRAGSSAEGSLLRHCRGGAQNSDGHGWVRDGPAQGRHGMRRALLSYTAFAEQSAARGKSRWESSYESRLYQVQ